MKAIRDFQEFIREGIVKKQSPNKSRAEFLIKESEQDYNYLLKLINQIGVSDDNANNYIKNCYDILMELIRAKMLLEGYNVSGYYAHEAEISFLRVLSFSEKDVQFADQIRFFRNGMLYYGTILEKEYAEKVILFTKNNYYKLRKMVK
jgi:hypothetical protein